MRTEFPICGGGKPLTNPTSGQTGKLGWEHDESGSEVGLQEQYFFNCLQLIETNKLSSYQLLILNAVMMTIFLQLLSQNEI